jgi:hypothetical protein
MPDEHQEVTKLDQQVGSICLLTVGELLRKPIEISDCQMHRIDKPTIYNALWKGCPAGYLPYRRKELIG